MDTTKGTRKPESASRPIAISCDYRADMKNGRIGMVLESDGSALDLGAMYAEHTAIMMFDRSSSRHSVNDIDVVYIKLASHGGTVVLRKDGMIEHVSEMSSGPITAERLEPVELERMVLEVEKPIPSQLSRGGEIIECIVAVPSATYDEEQVKSRTNGKTANFALRAQMLIKTAGEQADAGWSD